DAGKANFRRFKDLHYDHIPLFVEPFVHPGILQQYQGQLWCLEVNNPIVHWLEDLREPVGQAMTGGSVAHTTLDLLVQFGCNPIVLVGQDLAYTSGYTHARGTTHRKNAYEVATTRHRAALHMPGYYGGTVATSHNLYIYLKWFEEYIAQLGQSRTVIDATEGGAYIHGTKRQPL